MKMIMIIYVWHRFTDNNDYLWNYYLKEKKDRKAAKSKEIKNNKSHSWIAIILLL